jgi:hypothetical protein
MDLHILFIQRKEEYDGQFAPEALVVWDENCIEENPEGFELACNTAIKEIGSELWASKVIRVNVNGDKIRKLLVGVPLIEGAILRDE